MTLKAQSFEDESSLPQLFLQRSTGSGRSEGGEEGCSLPSDGSEESKLAAKTSRVKYKYADPQSNSGLCMFVFNICWICISACMFVFAHAFPALRCPPTLPRGKSEAANHLTRLRSNKRSSDLFTCWPLWPESWPVSQPCLEDRQPEQLRGVEMPLADGAPHFAKQPLRPVKRSQTNPHPVRRDCTARI